MRIEVDDIGMANAAEVATLGRAAIERGDAEFDLSGVVRCDSSAVAVLLEWQRVARARGPNAAGERSTGGPGEPGRCVRRRGSAAGGERAAPLEATLL